MWWCDHHSIEELAGPPYAKPVQEPSGIFFELWPLEKGHALTSHPFGGVIKAGSFGPGLFT